MIRLLALLSLLLLAAPARAKDDLVIGITQYPVTLHPGIESMLAKTYVLAMARRPITAYGPDWKLICMLCETLPTIDNKLAVQEKTADGKQGVALTYTLRADSVWADGTPVSTDDVLFTWEVGRHPQSGIANAELYRRILKIEAKDKRTFVLHLDRLTFDYNAINDFALLPAHVEKKRFQAAPAEYRNRTAYDQDSANPGLYNGPYRITQAVQGSHIVLEPNSHWKGTKAAFARIVVKTVENTPALEANLLSGGIDMIPGELGLPLDQAIAFAKRGDPRFAITFKSSLVYEHLDANLSVPMLADLRLRQALMYATDRAAISKQLFDGRQPVAHTAVNPLDGVHADDVPKYSFDPAKAARLLDEAGWPLQGNLRRNAKGEPLYIELATTAGNRTRELVAQVLQAQWKKLGIDLRIRTEPPRVLFGQTLTQRRFPGLVMYAWYSAPESVPRTTLHSSQIPAEANAWAGQNYPGYKNPRMDQLLDAIEVELDRPKRVELWRQLQHLYAEELPALPLFFRADTFILPKALKGVTPTGHQDPSTLWIETWRWG
ncbi:MAG: peptide ABC transporter substrate-binding protein [Alphaproteobacteria bacterium]|nr:peptide ABC transporter substrate-binding protein [Alphaproteobacteria bacterium]